MTMRKQATKTAKAPRRRLRLGVEGQKKRILAAASDLFAERGIDVCSVEHVLEATGVSRQTFYRCYRNKRDLVNAIHDAVTQRLVSTMSPIASDLGKESLDKTITRFFDYAEEIGPIVCELERESIRAGTHYEQHREGRREFGVRYLENWFNQSLGVSPPAELSRGLSIAFGQLFQDAARSLHQPEYQQVRQKSEKTARALMVAAIKSVGVDPSQV